MLHQSIRLNGSNYIIKLKLQQFKVIVVNKKKITENDAFQFLFVKQIVREIFEFLENLPKKTQYFAQHLEF